MPLWTTELGGKCYYAHGKQNARGVAILIGNWCPGVVKEVYRKGDRCIMLKLEIEETEYLIVNIYAPNNDHPQFFQNIIELMMKANATHYVMGEIIIWS